MPRPRRQEILLIDPVEFRRELFAEPVTRWVWLCTPAIPLVFAVFRRWMSGPGLGHGVSSTTCKKDYSEQQHPTMTWVNIPAAMHPEHDQGQCRAWLPWVG